MNSKDKALERAEAILDGGTYALAALEYLEANKDFIISRLHGENSSPVVWFEEDNLELNANHGWCAFVYEWACTKGSPIKAHYAQIMMDRACNNLGWDLVYPVKHPDTSLDSWFAFDYASAAEKWRDGKYAENRWQQLHELVVQLRKELGYYE